MATDPTTTHAAPTALPLGRDPLILATIAVFGAFAGIYWLPFVPTWVLERLVFTWADPVLIALALLAFQVGKRSLHRGERTFWTLMAVAFVCFSGGAWLGLLIPAQDWGAMERVVEDVFFLAHFVTMFVALSLNPHTDRSSWSANSLRFRLESIGTISFAALVFVYFVLTPIAHGDSASPLPSAAMRVGLDAMLVFSFLYIASFSASPRWTTIYRLFGAAIALWLVSDLVELLIVLGVVPAGIPYGTAYDFVWYVPFGLAIAAARIGRNKPDSDETTAEGLPARNPRRIRYLFGPLAVYTMSLPLMHFALSASGGLDPAIRSEQETCVLFGLLLLGSLTLVNEKLIERQRRSTEVENRRLAAFPIKNPNPFMTFSQDASLKYMNPAAALVIHDLGLDAIDEFLPTNHAELVADCVMTRGGVRDIEVEASERVFSFGYYPNPSGEDVFVYVMDVTDRKRAEGKLKYDALHDTLTGLPNRTLVLEILARAIERAERNSDYHFAVLFLDLNRFKVVNDSLGHLAGDRFLVEISRLLERSLRKNDIVGRFGGDEFVVVVDDIRDIHQATRAAKRIQAALRRPVEMDGHEIVTSACIGIAMSHADRQRPDDYLRDADIAMYRAKAHNKGFEVFDQRMHDEAVEQLELEHMLRRAIDGDELELFYQPYINLSDSRIVGFEGLVRWHHPEHGLTLPGQFIPLAEDTGLIIPLGWWVLEEACSQLQDWWDRDDLGMTPTLSCNISSKQLVETDFVRRLEAILDRHGFDRQLLTLELTESVMTDVGEGVVELMHQIKRLGVKLAIDDFGTGYSSLAYLREFPIDVLKIDRAFVAELGKSRREGAIVRAITMLTQSLGLVSIAEGVETTADANRLRGLGCNLAQGFLFSQPVPVDRAEELVRDDQRNALAQAG
jgi:diguanylate cyclase (GGDEF)-like protein